MRLIANGVAVALTSASVFGCSREERPLAAVARALSIAEVGFRTPESVLHDTVADQYLVSNVSGAPTVKDDDAFISRVEPDGSVSQLKWIDAAAADVTLNAPKGLAIRGDTVFVADIDVVRLFDRQTGAPAGEWPVPGSTFLNDLAIGPDGRVHVTDSGLEASADGLTPTGTDAIYKFDPDGTAIALVSGSALNRPNGIAFDGERLLMVGFNGAPVFLVDRASGQVSGLPGPPTGGLDGVVAMGGGRYLISSWEGHAVYELGAGGQYRTVVDSVSSPADIGFDARRGVVLVPVFTEDRVEIRPIH
jgi:hypothetical protein